MSKQPGTNRRVVSGAAWVKFGVPPGSRSTVRQNLGDRSHMDVLTALRPAALKRRNAR